MKKRASANPLVGKFALTFHDDDRVQYQIQICSCTPSGRYLIQFYDWIIGGASDQRLVDEEWFVREHARFYDDVDDWRHAGDQESRRSAMLREKQESDVPF